MIVNGCSDANHRVLFERVGAPSATNIHGVTVTAARALGLHHALRSGVPRAEQPNQWQRSYWRAQYELMQRLGHLDPAYTLADPDGVRGR
jgi:hypothetical protein